MLFSIFFFISVIETNCFYSNIINEREYTSVLTRDLAGKKLHMFLHGGKKKLQYIP